MHENGTECDGSDKCKNLPHMRRIGIPDPKVAAKYDARSGFGEPGGDIMFNASVIEMERELLNASAALMSLSGLAGHKPVAWPLKVATVLVHCAHRLVEAATKTRMNPNDLSKIVTDSTTKIAELVTALR